MLQQAVPAAVRVTAHSDAERKRQDRRHGAASALAPAATCTPQLPPPAAAGQPFPAFWQHHTFCSMDQPATQFSRPAAQSKAAAGGGAGVAQPAAAEGAQPLPIWWQHHTFLAPDQTAAQFSKPAAQSKGQAAAGGAGGGAGRGGGGGQPLPVCWQHHLFLSQVHVARQLPSPAAQLKGGAGARGAAGRAGGLGTARGVGLGGGIGVGSGKGGAVAGATAASVVVDGVLLMQPRPTFPQQKVCLAEDHAICQSFRPAWQSKGCGLVVGRLSSHHSRNSPTNRQRRLAPKIKQVRFFLGLTTPKSPPWPTYL